MPPPPPKKGMKATIHKVFILDAQGGYAGEYAPNENCVVEFSEFLAVLPEAGLGDGRSLFLGEWKATAIHGEKMSLVAISKGQLGPEEVSWAKAALVAAEAHLGAAAADEEDQPVVAPTPDKGVMENLARALDQREAALKEREKAAQEAETRAHGALAQYRQQAVGELAAVQERLSEVERERDAIRADLETEREKLRAEMARIANAPPPPPPAPRQPAGPDPQLEAMKKQMTADKKLLQQKALELLDREEKLRDNETKVADERASLAKAREEVDAMRAEISAKPASEAPSFDAEGAKREMDTRVKILQQKAFDLLAREEKLREREQKILAMLRSGMES